jgi:hypothetical protein
LTTKAVASTRGAFSALHTKRPPQLLTEAQLRDYRPVTLDVCFIQVGELSPALANHHQEAATRMVVFTVDAQMLSKVVYPLGEQSDLNLGGACVRLGLTMQLDYFSLSLCREHSASQAFLVTILLRVSGSVTRAITGRQQE